MLTDPQTINSVSLPRTGAGPSSGTFQSADGTAVFSVAHQYGKRTRRTVRYQVSKVSSDPLVPSTNTRSSMTVYLVVDTPVNGYTSAEAKAVVDAFSAWLTASTGANVTKVLGGES